ncbi:MFS transporter [Providencia rettgeri]|uniref:MFS transporter n=1 Tax=Providencia rettgeri TaxID=587 RepID=UPI00236273B7|nr:MFS transporter [Providencia rettgeri]
MLSRYQELFQAKGSQRFVIAGLLARLALPMMGIGIITMLAQLKGSYTLAGLVSATFVLTYALLSPQISRLVDKLGQYRVLPVVTLISLLGVMLLVTTTWLALPDAGLFIGAFLAGAMPSMSAMIRARWTALYKGQPILQTAYSLETVFDDATFIAGPPLSVGLTVALFPQAGLLVAAVLLLMGVMLLVQQRSTEPHVVTLEMLTPKQKSILSMTSLQLLIALMIALGVIVGSVDILSVTLAQLQQQPAAASLVLSAYAIGSCAMGLVFGALNLKTPLPRLLFISGVMTFLSIVPMWWVGGVYSLAVVVFISGLFFAPTMIIAMSLVENIVPQNRLTEGMTWLLAGLNIGVAIGAMMTGKMVDTYGLYAGFLVAIVGGTLVLLSTTLGYMQLNALQKMSKTCENSCP